MSPCCIQQLSSLFGHGFFHASFRLHPGTQTTFLKHFPIYKFTLKHISKQNWIDEQYFVIRTQNFSLNSVKLTCKSRNTRVDLLWFFCECRNRCGSMWMSKNRTRIARRRRSPASELSYCGNLNHPVESQPLSSPALLIPVWLNLPWTVFSQQAARQHDPAFSHCVRSLSRPHQAVSQRIKMVPCPPPHRSTTSQMRQRTKCSCAWTTWTTSHTCTSRTHRVCPSLCLWRTSSTTVLRAPAAKHSSGTTHTRCVLAESREFGFHFHIRLYSPCFVTCLTNPTSFSDGICHYKLQLQSGGCVFYAHLDVHLD